MKNSSEDVKELFDNPSYKIYLNEISDYLRWINERAVPLTACMLGISMLYILSFILEEQLPLTLSTITTILPALFILLTFFLGLSVSMLVCPLVFLLLTNKPIINKNDNNLTEVNTDLDEKEKENAEKAVAEKKRKSRIRLFYQWLVVNAIIAIGVMLSSWTYESSEVIAFVILFASLFDAAKVFLVSTTEPIKNSISDWITSAFIFLPQAIIVLLIFIFSTTKFGGENKIIYAISMTLVIVFIFNFIQVVAVCAVGFTSQTSKPLLINISLCFIGVIVFFGIFPTSSAFITKAVLNSTASGSRACTVFTLKKDDLENDYSHLIASENQLQTKPLHVIYDADGVIYARLENSNSKKLELIPRSIVTSIDKCTREDNK